MEGGYGCESRGGFGGTISLMGSVHRWGGCGVDCTLWRFCFCLGLLVHCSTESGHKKLKQTWS